MGMRSTEIHSVFLGHCCFCHQCFEPRTCRGMPLCAYVRLRIGWRARGGLQGAHLAEADDGSCLRAWHTHLSAVVQTDADAIRSCRRPRYVETKRLGLALRAVLCFLFFFLLLPFAAQERTQAEPALAVQFGPRQVLQFHNAASQERRTQEESTLMT